MENNNSFKEFTDWIFSLSGIDYTIAAVTIGVIMSKGLDVNEQNSVGSFFFLVGQVLITITNGELNRRIEFLFNELNNIKRNL